MCIYCTCHTIQIISKKYKLLTLDKNECLLFANLVKLCLGPSCIPIESFFLVKLPYLMKIK